MNLRALGPLIQIQRKHDENEANQNIQCAQRTASICASVAKLSLLRHTCAAMITFIMTCRLSQLASYIFKMLILDRIDDLSWA